MAKAKKAKKAKVWLVSYEIHDIGHVGHEGSFMNAVEIGEEVTPTLPWGLMLKKLKVVAAK